MLKFQQVFVEAFIPGRKVFMRSCFHQLAIADHKNPAHFADGAQTMCNNQGGPSGHQFFQCLLNQKFRFCIQGTGGFIQDEDRRILKYRAGNGNSLALPPGKLDPSVANPCFKRLREPFYKLQRICPTCCLDDFFVQGPWFSKCNVLEDSSAKQNYILRHYADIFPECGKTVFSNSPTINQNASLLNFVEPKQ